MGLRDLFRRGPTYADVQAAAFDALSSRLEKARAIDAAMVTPSLAVTGVPPSRRNVAPQEAYGQHVWTYVMANRVATALAMTSLKGVGSADEDVPLARLTAQGDFEQPNPRTSMFEHVHVLTVDAVTAGENYEVLDSEGMWRVEPARMKVIPSRTKGVERYEFMGDDGKATPFPPEQVIHRRLPNPINPWHGIGPGGVAVDDVKLDRQMDSYEQGFFDRGIRTSAVLETDKELVEADRLQMGREFMQAHGGPNGRWGVPVMSHGLKLREGGESHRDMEYGDGRKLLRDRHAALYGVPPFLAGDTDSVAYANAVQQMQVFVRFTVLPLARWMAHGWNNNRILFPTRGMRVAFDEKELFDAMIDVAVQATAAAALYDSGLYGRDALRHKIYRDAPMDEAEKADVKQQAPSALSPFGGPGLFPQIRMGYLERARARAEARERRQNG